MNLAHIDMEEIAPIGDQELVGGLHATFRGARVIWRQAPTGLSFCGDCWSPSQNWIESGLTTTEGLLQSTFRYRPPPWLPEGMGIST